MINADVLDAWFDPSPKVVEVLQHDLPWLLKTSPPTYADGFIKVIAAERGIKASCVLPGAGSSDLIFVAFRSLLNREWKVVSIDRC